MALDMSSASADNLKVNDYSLYNNKAVETVDKDEAGYLDFEGYLTLLSAQMANQDLNNSMSDSEFIQQMASYSMMEAISQMNKQSQLTYSASLIGKAVTVTNESGKPDTGIVEAVTMTSKGCNLLVNGNQYASTKITDVVDGEIYSKLNLFTGHKVELKDEDGNAVTGKVTSVFIRNGAGFVVLDNKKEYSLNSIDKIIDDDPKDEDEGDKDSEGTEGTEGADKGDNEGSVEGSGSDTGNGSESGKASVDGSAAASASVRNYRDPVGVTSRIGSMGADTLMRMLDGDNDTSSEMAYGSASVMSVLERMAAARSVQSAQVAVSEAGAGLPSDSDVLDRRVPAPSAYNNVQRSSDNGSLVTTASQADNSGNVYSSNVLNARSGISVDNDVLSRRVPAPSVYNQYLGIGNNTTGNTSVNNTSGNNSARLVNSTNTLRDSGNTVSGKAAKSTYDTGAEYGTLTVEDMNAAAQNLETYTSGRSISNVPSSTRKYADTYALEAAFADSTGTHMRDVRFIGNTDIMNRIDTSEIICYSEKGKPVTDLGWCGKGRLGEVVTFADGRQRVEIILGDTSSYLYTTGNYTLNEMFSNNVPGGYWYDKLTPQERALRHYAEEYTPEQQAAMNSFEDYAVRHAATYMG